MPFLRILFMMVVVLSGIHPGEAAATASLEDIQVLMDVPPTQATVTDAFGMESGALPDYVVVQDAHRHAEVQSRLAWIVLHGYKNWGVRKVFVEGAFTPVDLSVFHVLNEGERQSLSDHLVHKGKLSGPERAGVMIQEMEWRNPPVSPFELIGMEEPSLYQANLAAYNAVQTLRGKALEEVAEIRMLHNSLHLPTTHVLRRHLQLIEKMLDLRVTAAEHSLYLKAREAVPASLRLTPALEAAERFYELANQRSLVFVKNVDRKVPAAEGPRVLITGGFHTPLISQMFRSQGRSYVILTPRATVPGTDALYERRLQESSRLSEQLP